MNKTFDFGDQQNQLKTVHENTLPLINSHRDVSNERESQEYRQSKKYIS